MQAFMPRSKTRLIRYTDRRPLFARYGLDSQIESIYERRVELPSGGSIVIDRTEALTAIDVNSGRSTRASSQEETALNTNLEAAQEVARQLRLRDLGGLVVVDFIDMDRHGNRRRVEKAMKESMKPDKARHAVSRISMNGLLEINRQRVQQALLLRTHRSCPTCAGTGRIASPELVSLRLLRKIDAQAADGFKGTVRISLHPELADAFQNTRRLELASLESEFGIKIEIIASSGLHRSQEDLEWIPRSSDKLDTKSARKQSEALTIGDSASSSSKDQKKPKSSGPGRSRRRPKRGRKPQDARAAANRQAESPPKDRSQQEAKGPSNAQTSKPQKKKGPAPRKPRRRPRRRAKTTELSQPKPDKVAVD
jgi:ribonuclease E